MTDGARPDPHDARKAIVCRMLVRERGIVSEAFGRSLCANPVWDMLLALYIARCEQRFVMLTALCASSHASEGTAYRRIADLERRGLVVRNDDVRDRRRVQIRLSDDGVALVGDVLSRIDLLITSIGLEGR